MKRLNTLFLITLALIFAITSCSDKDDPAIEEKGTVISATYNPTTQEFTVKYSKGSTETVVATIDKSVNPATATATMEDGTIISVNDATVEGEASIGSLSAYKYVDDWIFEEMNIYYLWNDKLPKNPDFSAKPDKFFNSLLNTYDKNTNPQGDRFSWIQEDYVELLGSLSGVSSDEIGFEYFFVAVNEARTQYYALVTYPKKGSDAHSKGIGRGRFITAVDGKNITSTNYRTIFSGTGSKTLSMADFVHNSEENKYVLTAYPEPVTIQMEKNFAENPIYMDSIYTINDKKIGYMVYNFFAADKGDNSHDYDRLLMNTLSNIKDKGANEMVLDLRYNGGGRVSTAIALASALVKDKSTDNILVTAEYNALVHAALKREEGADYNKDYFVDKVQGTNIEVPALNLPRLYVLVTGGSASASELIINGLKPYIDVKLIGETTYGKNVGSISIYEDDDPKNKWGMQPIIVRYANSKGESDFTAGFKPDFEVNEFTALKNRFVEFGDTEDPLLSKAIEQITGSLPTRSSMRKNIPTYPKMIEVEGTNSIFKDKSRFEMYDDVRGEKIKKLMKESN
ncbi:MAG: peptidase S41 [Bacteroidales bacterium]|nr:peptidase S41 [Bacteroidales bacterium]